MSYKITFVVAISIFIITGFAGVANAQNCGFLNVLCRGPWTTTGGGGGGDSSGDSGGFLSIFFRDPLGGGNTPANSGDSSSGEGSLGGGTLTPDYYNNQGNSNEDAPCDETLLPSVSTPTTEESGIGKLFRLFSLNPAVNSRLNVGGSSAAKSLCKFGSHIDPVTMKSVCNAFPKGLSCANSACVNGLGNTNAATGACECATRPDLTCKPVTLPAGSAPKGYTCTPVPSQPWLSSCVPASCGL